MAQLVNQPIPEPRERPAAPSLPGDLNPTVHGPRPFRKLTTAIGAALAALLSTTAGVPMAEAATGTSAGLMAQSSLEAIALQCRLQGGPWRQCRMRIESVGEHWWLDVGDQVLEFRHDGRGLITVKQGAGPQKTVESRWDQASSALCWDGICTLGAIPLD